MAPSRLGVRAAELVTHTLCPSTARSPPPYLRVTAKMLAQISATRFAPAFLLVTEGFNDGVNRYLESGKCEKLDLKSINMKI